MVDEEVVGPSSAAPVVRDDSAAMRRFLEDVGLIVIEKDPMTLSEKKESVRGRMTRQTTT